MTRGLETITVSFILPFINCFQPFSDCKINVEGMKIISSFLSHDGVVLEELDLGLKKRRNVTFQHETVGNSFGDEGCVPLVEGLKKNKTLKKLNIAGISSTIFLLLIIFQHVESLLKE